jgi:hypothetical protein
MEKGLNTSLTFMTISMRRSDKSFITGWLIAFVEPLVILFIYKTQSFESTTDHNL